MRNSNFKSYESYKDICVKWLGEIPKHWSIRRIKEVNQINKESLSETTPTDYEFEYIDIGSVTYGEKFYKKEKMFFGEAPSRAKRIVRNGDTIVSTVRTYLKAIAAIEEESKNLIASTGFCVLTPSKKIVSKYCSLLIGSEYIINEISASSVGVSYPSISSFTIGNLFFIIPPIEEQTAIANYLDEKTALIDKKINLLAQKADKYKELKQALINETVTHGLNKNVKLKDSGVEWIGKIPEHWEVKRAKDIFFQTRAKAGTSSSCYDVLSLTLKGVIKRDLETMVGKIPASFDTYQIAKKDNLILCLFDMDVTPRIIGYVNFEGIVTSAYTVLVGKKNTISKYYYYYYLEQNRNKSLLANSKTLRSTMTYDLFSQLQVPVPPKNEQTQIAEYLDKKTSQLDKIVESINNQIEKLKELRKTLINDVVTGKIKVTDE